MAYNPISGFTLQTIKQNGQTAEGYYLKFYIANTTTPLSMATDATGGTLLSECKLNDNGMPISNPLDNSTVFIPYVNQNYRLVIYRNKADADANDTASSFVNIADVSTLLSAEGATVPYADISELPAVTTGQRVSVTGYHPSTTVGGGEFVGNASARHDGGRFIDPDRSGEIGTAAYYVDSGSDVPCWERIIDKTISPTDYGAIADATSLSVGTDSTLAIQAAVDSPYDVDFGKYNEEATSAVGFRITDSIKLKHSKKIYGGGGIQSFYYKPQCRIYPDGNFPVFTNQSGFAGAYFIDGFFADWGLSKPTDVGTQGNRYMFYFVDRGDGLDNQYYEIRNCEANGGWGVYYDDTDAYKCVIKQVIGRYCKNGFYKRLGTMMVFDTCSNSLGDQGFFLENTVSPTLINCSADSNDPVSGVTDGDAVNYFFSCSSVSILGWDVEGNNLSGDQISYMRFRETTATVTGLAGLSNSMSCTVGEWITWIRSSNNSEVLLNGVNLKSIAPATDLSFSGTGECSTFRADTGGELTIIAGDATAPTGGTPSARYSLRGTGGEIYVLAAESDQLTSGVRFNSYSLVTEVPYLRLAPTTTGTGTVTEDRLKTYEEGTFTASLRAGGVEWKTIEAAFTRVGRMVTIHISDENSTYSAGPSGLFTIENLPFTSINDTSKKAVGSFTCREIGTGVTEQITCAVENNENKIIILEQDGDVRTQSNVNAEQLFAFNGASGNYFSACVTYLTADV